MTSMLELELFQLRLDDIFAIAVLRLVLEVIVLMIGFGRIEIGGPGDLSDNGFIEVLGSGGLGGGGGCLLDLGMIENDRAVLRTVVVALAVEGGRIMQIPEPGEQALIGDFLRIKHDAHHLGMTGGFVTHLFVGGICHVAARITRGYGKHAIELVAEWAGDLGEIEADETVLATALFNILENAVDACAQDRRRPAHRITVRVSGHRAHVEIEFADDGIGMPPAIKEKIFDMFYSSKGHAGTGLGLFIARQMIRQHGGTIQVESTEGVGSRFRVHLPRVLPEAEKERQPEAPPA